MALADVDDLRILRGLDPLGSGDEDDLGQLVLDLVTSLIASALDRDDVWADALDPIPAGLRVLCLKVAMRVVTNPEQLRSISEQAGNWSESKTFEIPKGLELTNAERQTARRAVGMTGLASPHVGSVLDDLIEFPSLLWTDDEFIIGILEGS